MTLRRAALAVAVLLAAGCASEAGQAVPAAPVPPSSAVPTVTAVPGVPPRPVALPLGSVDPCTLLTPEQRGQFGLTSEPNPGTQPSEDGGPTCDWFKERGGGVSFIVSTANGIGVWFDGSRGGEVTPMQVAGFPAAEVRDESLDPPYCEVAVDMADGQHLGVLNSPTRGEPAPIDEQCAQARMYAEAAVQTLMARR